MIKRGLQGPVFTGGEEQPRLGLSWIGACLEHMMPPMVANTIVSALTPRVNSFVQNELARGIRHVTESLQSVPVEAGFDVVVPLMYSFVAVMDRAPSWGAVTSHQSEQVICSSTPSRVTTSPRSCQGTSMYANCNHVTHSHKHLSVLVACGQEHPVPVHRHAATYITAASGAGHTQG